MIRIGNTEFPDIAVSKMLYLSKHRVASGDCVQITGISDQVLLVVLEFLEKFKHMPFSLNVMVPRYEPLSTIIPQEILIWVNYIDLSQMEELHSVAQQLGYVLLYEISTLVLSDNVSAHQNVVL